MSIRTALAFGGSIVALVMACGGNDHPPVLGNFFATSDVDAGVDSGVGGFGGSSTGGNQSSSEVDEQASCDSSLAVDGSATALAQAIGICATVTKDGFGLVSASFTSGYALTTPATDGQWGILPSFGAQIVPREGASLGALSTGWARVYDDEQGKPGNDFVESSGMTHANAEGAAPPGYPKAASGCTQDNVVNDVIDFHLVLQAPQDATGFQFDFDFYSSEWPNYVCSNFNDSFVAYLTSKEKTDNISFDAKNNPVSVNNGFFDRCTPNTTVGCAGGDATKLDACPGGSGELGDTGFGTFSQTACPTTQLATDGGATGWLTTQTAVAPGEQFTIDFLIWNAGDEQLDSLVLLDNFEWLGGSVSTGTTRVK